MQGREQTNTLFKITAALVVDSFRLLFYLFLEYISLTENNSKFSKIFH